MSTVLWRFFVMPFSLNFFRELTSPQWEGVLQNLTPLILFCFNKLPLC